MKYFQLFIILVFPFFLTQTSHSLAQSPEQLKTAYAELTEKYDGIEKIQHHRDPSGIMLTFVYHDQPGFSRYTRQLKWLGTAIQLKEENITDAIKLSFRKATNENPAQIVKIGHPSGNYFAVYGGDKSLENLGNTLPENGILAAMNSEIKSKYSLGSYAALQEFPTPFVADYQHFLLLFFTENGDPVSFDQIQPLLKRGLIPFPNQFPGLPWFQDLAWMPGVNWTP